MAVQAQDAVGGGAEVQRNRGLPVFGRLDLLPGPAPPVHPLPHRHSARRIQRPGESPPADITHLYRLPVLVTRSTVWVCADRVRNQSYPHLLPVFNYHAYFLFLITTPTSNFNNTHLLPVFNHHTYFYFFPHLSQYLITTPGSCHLLTVFYQSLEAL